MNYQIARDLEEATWQALNGFGYETREAAEENLKRSGIDPLYRHQLGIFKLETIENNENATTTNRRNKTFPK